MEKAPKRIRRQFYLSSLRILLKLQNRLSIQNLDRKDFPYFLLNSVDIVERLEELYPEKDKLSVDIHQVLNKYGITEKNVKTFQIPKTNDFSNCISRLITYIDILEKELPVPILYQFEEKIKQKMEKEDQEEDEKEERREPRQDMEEESEEERVPTRIENKHSSEEEQEVDQKTQKDLDDIERIKEHLQKKRREEKKQEKKSEKKTEKKQTEKKVEKVVEKKKQVEKRIVVEESEKSESEPEETIEKTIIDELKGHYPNGEFTDFNSALLEVGISRSEFEELKKKEFKPVGYNLRKSVTKKATEELKQLKDSLKRIDDPLRQSLEDLPSSKKKKLEEMEESDTESDEEYHGESSSLETESESDIDHDLHHHGHKLPEIKKRVFKSPPRGREEKSKQKKVPWSVEEENNLVKGIERYGAGKWSEILSSYQFHPKRDSVSLRDKWRNLQKQK